MLTALDHQHQLILATDASRATHYYCPGCRHAVTLRKGQRVVAHFAHQPGNRCNVTTESESQQHLTWKWQLARFFKHDEVRLEPYLSDIQQRPDLLLIQPGKRVAIEFQCSPLSPSKLAARNAGYQKLNVTPVWVLGDYYFQHMKSQSQVALFANWSRKWGWYLLFWHTQTARMELWSQLKIDLLGRIGYQRYQLTAAGESRFIESRALCFDVWQIKQLRQQITYGLRFRTHKYMKWQNFCYMHNCLLQTIPNCCFEHAIVPPLFGDSIAILRYCLLILISDLGQQSVFSLQDVWEMVAELGQLVPVGQFANCNQRVVRNQLQLVLEAWLQTLTVAGYLQPLTHDTWQVTRQFITDP